MLTATCVPAFETTWMSPIVGETRSTSPGFDSCELIFLIEEENSSHISTPRITPTSPHTVWSWIGVRCPGIQTKLTTEKRSSGSQYSRYWRYDSGVGAAHSSRSPAAFA